MDTAVIKYTAVNEMGLCMADEMYLLVDEVTKDDLAVDPAFEAANIQPTGEVGLEKGPALSDLLNKWEVQIVLRAADEDEVESMYAQMMDEARAVGYDEIKMELYNRYVEANS